MAKKLMEVLIDIEYSDGADIGESSSSMIGEVTRIIESGAAENGFDVVHVLAHVAGVESLFELTEQ